LGGHWPEVYDACDPSLIEWKNLGVNSFSRLLRQIIVYLLCLIIIGLGFTGIVYASNYSQQLTSNPVTEATCGTTAIDKSEAQADYNKPVDERQNILNCYCF
jgi:hypothetical protein